MTWNQPSVFKYVIVRAILRPLGTRMIHSQSSLLGLRFGKLGEVNLPLDASNMRPQAAKDADQLLALGAFK